MAAIYGVLTGYFNPIFAESLSIREVLSWLNDLNFHNIIVESGALLVVDALNADSSDASSLGLILDDCRSLARNYFYVFLFLLVD